MSAGESIRWRGISYHLLLHGLLILHCNTRNSSQKHTSKCSLNTISMNGLLRRKAFPSADNPRCNNARNTIYEEEAKKQTIRVSFTCVTSKRQNNAQIYSVNPSAIRKPFVLDKRLRRMKVSSILYTRRSLLHQCSESAPS